MDNRLVRGEEKFNDAAVIHTFLGDARIGLWVIELEDGKAPRMYADESMLDLLGVTETLTPEECYDFWFSRVDESEISRVEQAVARINAFEFAEVHYAYHHPTRGTIYVRCGGTRDPKEHRFASLNGFHQDITDLQEISKTTEQLRVNHDELLFSLNNLFSSLYRVDPLNQRVTVMRAPDDTMVPIEQGYDDFIQFCAPYVHPDDREAFLKDFAKERLQEAWLSGAIQYAREYRRKFADGYRWVAFQVYFCEPQEGRKWGILGTRDVHERRSGEEQARERYKDACQAAEKAANAKMEFLSHMSHDVRTPINQILGMTTLARAVKEDPKQLMTCIGIIEEAGTKLYHLINEILDVSRADNEQIRLEKEALSISGLVRYNVQTVEADARAKNITIHTSQNVRHDRVLGDQMRLSEILLNYLTNAIKYTAPNGKISLTVTELPQLTGSSIGYQFDCIDTGIGIPEDMLPHVFEPFWRAEDSRVDQTPGAGLGLAVVRNVASLMNGWVDVKSTVGVGSCFTAVVYLEPVADEAVVTNMTADTAQGSEEIRLDGISALVVEDNEINRDIAVELLQMAGATAETAENGLQAVEAYADHGTQYQVILMDIKMPVMDGNEATRRIREIEAHTGRHIPIIALTANSYAEDIFASIASGVDRHITKPYDQHMLFRTIRELVQAE